MATSKQTSLQASNFTGKRVTNKFEANSSTNANLESFACLWLDQNVNSTQDNLITQHELRQIINHLQTFENSDQCEEYIQQIIQEKVILIVSGSLGSHIVPRLHSLSQFSACYVFCSDKTANEQWACKYHKVKGVFVERSELIANLAKDQTTRAKVEEGASIAVISHSSQSLQARNAIFMWFQLFIEVLLRMHHKSTDRKELIQICKKNYKHNDREIIIINEFEKNYKSDNAIWWYTREACFYRMMNKALRVQDYDMLFALRFFITDIAKQLRNEHENFIRTSDTRSVIHVYRGQGIGMDELELMKNSVGEYLSMNSFLSTSYNRSTAMNFARLVSKDSGYQAILFEIEINPRMKTKAFGDIHSMSYYENEGEVLIMLGALFRIDRIVEDRENGMWIGHLSLASEDDYHLKEMFVYRKEKIGDDTNLDSLGKILLEMGEYEQARKCYERLLEEGQLIVGDARSGVGVAYRRCKEYEKSLKNHRQGLEIREQTLGPYHTKVADCYRGIALVYWEENNHGEALINISKAIEIYEKAETPDPMNQANAYNSAAITYYMMGEQNLALQFYHKTLKMQQDNLPADHPEIARTYNNLGALYGDDGQPNKALECYEKSLNIKRKTLPPTHPDIIRTENNIKQLKKQMEK